MQKHFHLTCIILGLVISANAQLPYIQYINRDHQFSIQNLDPPIQSPKASKPPEWGTYFWEFGDGHYSFDETPIHQFTGTLPYEVKVYLTPHYSFSKPLSLSKKISVKGTKGPVPTYDLDGQWIHLESNAGQYLVPGHDIQMVIHYQAPPEKDLQEGYVILFYNNKKESKDFGIKFSPFLFREERLYYDEKALGEDFFSLPQQGLSGEGLKAAKTLFNEYNNVRIFKISPIKAGREQRLFCTINGDQRLENYQDKNRELSITALWLPKGAVFDARKCRTVHKMEILEVHDPNRIKVQKTRAYYLAKHPTQLRYKVDFQNKAKGVVKDVVVRIPIPEELKTESLEIQENRLNPAVPACPDSLTDTGEACYTLETKVIPGKDSLIFTFYNISLKGTKGKGLFVNKSHTKGSFSFSVYNSRKRVTETPLRAYIYFLGSREIIQTQLTSTKWRQRSINLSLGQNFHQRANHFVNSAQGFGQRYNISFSALDAPLGKGLLFGLQGGATAFNFTRVSIDEVSPSFLLPDGGIWTRNEQISLKYLEAKVLSGYQLNRFIRFHAGGGFSVPLKAELNLEAFAATAIDADPVIYAQGSTTSGILNNSAPARIFEQDIDPHYSMGFNFFLGMEVGLPNDLSLGLNHELRYFPRSYNDACSHIRSWQIYLKGKLFAFR